MATHSSILAWRIPQTEEPGRLQSIGSQRVGHDLSDLAHIHIEIKYPESVQFSCSVVSDSATPWTAARQASVHHQLISFESVMPSNYLILCCPLLLLPSIFPSIRVFSNESSSHQVAKILEFQRQYQSFQ